jgi:hypothetical protein
MAEWYDSALILRDFAEALDDAGVVQDASEVFKKPYKFNDEYAIWVSVKSPSQEDAEWDEFITALEAEEGGDSTGD